jgi:putative MATE family efflux protein
MKELFGRPWSRVDFIKFVTPSILSLISISLYMAVDTVFISRFVGTLAMASVNIIMPLFSFSLGIGIMVSAGASAIIGMELGQGKHDLAKGHFSFVFCFLFAVALGLIALGHLLGIERICLWLGATERLMPYCVDYLNIFLLGIGALVLQMFFEFAMRLDGKPVWAFYSSLIGGGTNIVLDYIFIVRLGMGIEGAAMASVAGILASCLNGTIYFFFKANMLTLVRPRIDWRFLLDSMINGSSEMVSELASGVKTLVFNYTIIKYAGEAGVAAMSILMSMFFLLSSLYIGLSMGVSPVISFNYGSRNFEKIREVVAMAVQVTLLSAVGAFVFGIFCGDGVIQLFAKGQDSVVSIAGGGLRIVVFTFLINGINILGSAFFTAVNNGKVSALISALRSFVFTLGFIAILPLFFGLNGIWLSLPAAELAALVVTWYFTMKYRGRYLFGDRSFTERAAKVF